jgi:RimJ/RimL family protein N-acetyltransferase
MPSLQSTAASHDVSFAPALSLRPLVDDDARALAPSLRLPPATEGFFEGSHAVGELPRWLEDARGRGVCLWTVTRGERPVGLVTARFEQGAIARLGFCLDGDAETEAGEALGAAVRWIFAATPVHRVTLRTTTFDVARWRAAQAAGFRLEGVARAEARWAGVWHDTRHYACLREDFAGRNPDAADTNL